MLNRKPSIKFYSNIKYKSEYSLKNLFKRSWCVSNQYYTAIPFVLYNKDFFNPKIAISIITLAGASIMLVPSLFWFKRIPGLLALLMGQRAERRQKVLWIFCREEPAGALAETYKYFDWSGSQG